LNTVRSNFERAQMDTTIIDQGIQQLQSGRPEDLEAFQQSTDQLIALGNQIRGGRAGVKPGALRTFEGLTAGLSEEDVARAQRIELGLDPRAVGTGKITTATTEGLTEKVAESEELIKQRTKFAEMTGASRAKTIDSAFARIETIDKNIRNVDRAIAAIDEGASTGVIESRFFPSIRTASLKLDQIGKEMGLDVVSATTFGALSKGELDLSLRLALPKGLEPGPLKEWLQTKRAAQEKLRAYLEEAVNFLDQGGTVAGFLRSKRRQLGEAGQQAAQPGAGAQAAQPRQGGQIMIDAQGNRARVFADGTFEEL